MISIRQAALGGMLVMLLVGCASTVSAIKVYYGLGYRIPAAKQKIETVKPFFSTSYDKTGTIASLTAVGVVWTKALLGDVASLPLSSTMIPDIGGNFNYTGITIPMTFNNMDQTGANPNASVTGIAPPFGFVRATYTPSGFTSNGNTPSASVGVYKTPLWAVSFHLDSFTTWAKSWEKPATGPCVGLSKGLFAKTVAPVAAKCYPGGRFANVGNILNASGTTVLDLSAPEWSTNPGTPLTTTALQYGQFNGAIEYLQILVTQDFLLNQTSDLICKDIKFLPKALPQAMSFPSQFCVRNVGSTVVVDLRRFSTIPAGDCNVTATNPASSNSYYPSAFNPPYLDASCLLNITA